MFVKRTLTSLLTAAWLFACGASAFAQEPLAQDMFLATPSATGATDPDADQAATFSADEVTHDQELNTITARGNVEVNQGGQTLYADTISYDQRNDIIHANGNITLHRPNGEVMFAEKMEISGDLRDGLIEDFRAIMTDKSRFAAKRAQLVNDETLTLDRAVYSPCQACQDDPTRPLLWQLKAVKVVHDRVNKTVKYSHAWLEFAGVPILYTPYLSHPDPSVKRKSGFIAPRVGNSTDLGTMVQTPYFYVLDDYSDVTLTPILTTSNHNGAAGEYREKFTKGEIKSTGSLVYNSNSNAGDIMGHIAATSRFDLNESWRFGADVNRTTTDTYMRRFGFGNDPMLTSKLFVEGFRGNNYANVSAMSFQDLRASSVSDESPVVLPMAQFSHQGETQRFGAYNTLDANLVKITRSQGTDSTRISVKPGWTLPYTAPKGDVYKLSATMGVDFFHTQALAVPAARGDTYNGAALRVNPELAFDWRWPLAKRDGTVTQVIEPIGQVIVSPYGGNSYKMANEDSQDFDFNDTNLFSTNRFTGYDRVESGPRTNYGIQWGAYGDNGGSTSVLIGQSYRLSKDDTFQTGSGLENNFSDYIGRVRVSPGEHLDLLYRTRVDKKTLDFKRNELGLSGSKGWFRYGADFVSFARQQGSEFNGRKELSYRLGAQVTDFWSTRLAGVRDLSANGGQRSNLFGLTYDDECFRFDATMSRTFYLDREIKPNDSIMFLFVFKTLGEITTNATDLVSY